jgi:hypothetical protein
MGGIAVPPGELELSRRSRAISSNLAFRRRPGGALSGSVSGQGRRPTMEKEQRFLI